MFNWIKTQALKISILVNFILIIICAAIIAYFVVFGKGISKTGNILDVAVNLDIVKKAGAWFSYNEEKLGQGREKAKEFLDANPEILAEVERLVREKLENQ